MKKIISLLLVAITITLFTFNTSAYAGNAANGAKIFSMNCASCHVGGKGLVPGKSLSKADLETNGKFSEAAIIAQVKKGAGIMPALARLGDANIEDVAAYVFAQAEKGW